MNITVELRDQNSQNCYKIDIDSDRLTGGRSIFGPYLNVGTMQIRPQPSNLSPLFFSGSLVWNGESSGLPIPPQALAGGTSSLNIPVSDRQLRDIESVRKGGSATFQIRLRLFAQLEDGKVLHLGAHDGTGAYSYVVPLDCWFRALDACGYGLIRIVELPPTPNSALLTAAATSLEAASEQYRRGDYSPAATSARTALDNIIEAMRLQLQIAEPKSQWGQRVDQIVEALDALSLADKTVTYKLYSEIIKSAVWLLIIRGASAWDERRRRTIHSDDHDCSILSRLSRAAAGFRSRIRRSKTVADFYLMARLRCRTVWRVV